MPDLVSWLLESPIPSIRYLTLRQLVGHDEQDKEVRAARNAMQTTGPIPAILAKQTPSGEWEGSSGYYSRKYVGTHWSLIVLLELAADPDDVKVRRGVEYMLSVTTDKNYMLEDRYDRSVPSPEEFGFICLWANILRYAAHFNYADDTRLKPIIEYMIRNLDSGRCHCIHNVYLPCAWGAIRALWGLAAFRDRSDPIIRKTLDFILASDYQLTSGNYPSSGAPHKMWSQLNFPLFYQVDILFTLRVLAELDVLDHPGAQPALEWLLAQRQSDGRWQGTSPFRSRTWKQLGGSQDTHRWVSLQAATVLRQANLLQF